MLWMNGTRDSWFGPKTYTAVTWNTSESSFCDGELLNHHGSQRRSKSNLGGNPPRSSPVQTQPFLGVWRPWIMPFTSHHCKASLISYIKHFILCRCLICLHIYLNSMAHCMNWRRAGRPRLDSGQELWRWMCLQILNWTDCAGSFWAHWNCF